MPRLPLPKAIEPPQPFFAIDAPTPCQRFSGWIDIRGWALVASGRRLVVRVSVDDVLVRTLQPSLARPDIGARYPEIPASDRSGFECRLRRDELPDRDHLMLKFEVHAPGVLGRVLQRSVHRLAVERHRERVPTHASGQVDQYVTAAPSPRNAVEIFAGEWSSRLPEPFAGLPAGSLPLFDDPRLQWGLSALGGVRDRRVVEIGPLEGGHTWTVERGGAREVVAIEANARAYLRCLIVKELIGLTRTRFLLGDALEYLRGDPEPFDLAVVSGVLYHLQHPVELMARLARVAPRVYVWTHYVDPAARRSTSEGFVFGDPVEREFEGFRHTVHSLHYEASVRPSGFCGGTASHAHWLSRDDILGCCRHFGLTEIVVDFEEPDHATGPSFAFVASRPGA